MSASLRDSGPLTASGRSSFYARCIRCTQIGLFATVEGFLACGWRLLAGAERPERRKNGLLVVSSTCARCRDAARTPKFAPGSSQ